LGTGIVQAQTSAKFTSSNVSVPENAGSAKITISCNDTDGAIEAATAKTPTSRRALRGAIQSSYGETRTTLSCTKGGSTVFEVPLADDSTAGEDNESVNLILIDKSGLVDDYQGGTGVPEGALLDQATLTIVDDDVASAGELQLSPTSATVNESYGAVSVTVERVNGSYGPASVSVSTSDGSANSGSDYGVLQQTLQWCPLATTTNMRPMKVSMCL
jgi:hypothetical protein